MKKIVNFIKQVLITRNHRLLDFTPLESFKGQRACIFMVFLLLSPTIYAQDKKPIKIYGEKSEEKTEQNTYYKHFQGDYIFMYNKNNTLLPNTFSSFFERLMDYPNPIFSVSNRPILDSYIKKWIVPHFKGMSSFNDKISCVEIALFSDIDGNIKEIYISYPADGKLPLSAFESLENDILASNVKIIFDKDKNPFKDAAWVNYPLTYTLAKLKQMGSEK